MVAHKPDNEFHPLTKEQGRDADERPWKFDRLTNRADRSSPTEHFELELPKPTHLEACDAQRATATRPWAPSAHRVEAADEAVPAARTSNGREHTATVRLVWAFVVERFYELLLLVVCITT